MRCALWVAVLLGCSAMAAADCPTGQGKDEATVAGLERTWAQALDKHDVAVVGCLLAEEFQDVTAEGALADRAATLARIPARRPSENHLEELHAHIYGDMAYVRGMDRVTDASGSVLARVRFTDIFVYRDGRWQAVAGHETAVVEKSH
jgi:hypothetical protein